MKSISRSACTIAVLSFFVSASPASAVTLIDEDFAGFGASQTYGTNTVTWSDDDGTSGFENYTSNFGARQTDQTYDDDNNGGTPDIAVVGAIEVNDDAGAVTLTGSFVLPGTVSATDVLELRFAADYRGTLLPDPGTVQIFNVTDGTDILATTSVAQDTANRDWEPNFFSAPLSASDLGDTIEIRFFGGAGSSGASGLQVTLIELDAVPEPSSLALLGLGGLLIARRRR